MTTFETCSPNPSDADPHTTLVVYQISNLNDNCDLDSSDVVGCNDDATVSAADHLLRPQFCKFSGITCDDSADCQRRCSVNGTPCTTPADCPTNQVCAIEPCLSSCGAGSAVTVSTTSGQLLKIRLGAEIGSQPSGTLTIRCGIIDCNQNSIPDALDIANGAPNCNQNAVPDECELTDMPSSDCNANGLLDVCEIDLKSSVPGGPFFCEANCQLDCDANGRIDSCDLENCPVNQPSCSDCNQNGILDGCDVAAGVPLYEDNDGDGTVNCTDQCPGLDDSVFAPGCAGAIPTTSHWGLAVLALLLLVSAKLRFGHPKVARGA